VVQVIHLPKIKFQYFLNSSLFFNNLIKFSSENKILLPLNFFQEFLVYGIRIILIIF